ncbi:ribosomal maturation YjgA family protein [Streptomyces sp. NPDC003401]
MTSPGTGAGTGREADRTRLAAAVAAPAVVGAGLGLRAVAAGDVAKYGGDALYTLLLVALVVLVAPRVMAWRAGALALAVSWAVEFLQLGGLPAELSRRSTAARLVLGSTFDAPDLFWYAVGALTGWLVLAAVPRPSRPPTARPSSSPRPGRPGSERGAD